MKYNISKLNEINPELSDRLQNTCYDLMGCCQEIHKEMGPFLNEYIYQDALEIVLNEREIPHFKEFYFSVVFHGKKISHKHYVDFFCREKVYIECKAVEQLNSDHRQQLWNYMRLTNVPIGILYNFAPVMSQCERYYLDTATKMLYLF